MRRRIVNQTPDGWQNSNNHRIYNHDVELPILLVMTILATSDMFKLRRLLS